MKGIDQTSLTPSREYISHMIMPNFASRIIQQSYQNFNLTCLHVLVSWQLTFQFDCGHSHSFLTVLQPTQFSASVETTKSYIFTTDCVRSRQKVEFSILTGWCRSNSCHTSCNFFNPPKRDQPLGDPLGVPSFTSSFSW